MASSNDADSLCTAEDDSMMSWEGNEDSGGGAGGGGVGGGAVGDSFMAKFGLTVSQDPVSPVLARPQPLLSQPTTQALQSSSGNMNRVGSDLLSFCGPTLLQENQPLQILSRLQRDSDSSNSTLSTPPASFQMPNFQLLLNQQRQISSQSLTPPVFASVNSPAVQPLGLTFVSAALPQVLATSSLAGNFTRPPSFAQLLPSGEGNIDQNALKRLLMATLTDAVRGVQQGNTPIETGNAGEVSSLAEERPRQPSALEASLLKTCQYRITIELNLT